MAVARYGDFAPIARLNELKKIYSNLHLYIDDAHGTGCFGKHGEGYALSVLEDLERVVVAHSYGKSFCCGGGSLVIQDDELRRDILQSGPTNIFSGPMQPATTGAAIASAKFHLSSEYQKLQRKLMDKIRLRNQIAVELDLPVNGPYDSPICFIKVGDPVAVKNIVLKLMENGYYVNPSHYPAVPMNEGGIRITTTTLQEDEDIKNLLYCIKDLIS
ncbi:MAG: aminotransferase class I/II-fold pyridoxal phosphate-dependent enzyme [bacterium]|nr:aminotransferase class I/II-fold pyridoxal phosphate-dependent enzyme [bacterium]